MVKFGKMLILAAATMLGAASAQAAIYDTGVPLSLANGSVDSNWTVKQVAGSFSDNAGLTNAPNAYIASDQSSFPFGYWVPPLTGSQWIVPTPGGQGVSLDPNVNGYYLYREVFNAAAGSRLSGQFLADNDVTKIFLYDLTTHTYASTLYSGPGEGGYTAPTSFSSGVLTGDTYVLGFVVNNFAQNGGNPSGLDVAVSAVPESSTWAMMILGFLGMGFLGYRKSLRATDQTFRLA